LPELLAGTRVNTNAGLAALAHGPDALRLMTMRSEGQFNTVVYEEEDIYRGQERRDVILMNAHDIARLGLRVDQRVTVRSDAGHMPNILVREGELTQGNCAMYYPEANVLVPRIVDAQSRTPVFKSVAVTVEPVQEAGAMIESSRGDVNTYAVAGTSRSRMKSC
jgi:anaerobic selenocysteine-containing dehydrogenase